MAHHLGGAHTQGVEGRDFGFEDGILGDGGGGQLLLDPLVESDGVHRGDVVGARSEGQAIERVQGLLIRSHLGHGRRGGGLHFFPLGVKAGGKGSERDGQDDCRCAGHTSS